jgi:hypothetical protein
MRENVTGILGGAFGLQTPGAAVEPPFRARYVRFFLSVRCILRALIETHKPKSAWLPSYLCREILTPFKQAQVAVRFYAIDSQLRVSGDHGWIGEIQAGDLVLVIHYFGFPDRSFPAREIAERGALLIEDASQALFCPQQFPESLGILYSPRKFLGVPDSGVLVSDAETGLESMKLEPPPDAWWRAALKVSLNRREFDLTGQPDNWFVQFQQVERDFPVGPFRASDLSRTLLLSMDYAAMRARRRANYARLLELAERHAVFPVLGPDVVPLGFPIRVEKRDELLSRLHAAKIYAPVHWRIEGTAPPVFRESHELSATSITLLCDQRCTLRDMERQAAELFG